MNTKKSAQLTTVERPKENLIYTDIITFPAVFSKERYSEKPSKNGRLFSYLHKSLNHTKAQETTLTELLERVAQGYVFKNGMYKKETLNEKDWETLREYRKEPVLFEEKKQELESHKGQVLTSARLAVLDVDDVLGKTDPEAIMREFGAVALYYSYSHQEKSPIGTIMNRYRLLFALSDEVDSTSLLRHVQDSVKRQIIERYPFLQDHNYRGRKNGIDNLTELIFGTNKGYTVNPEFEPLAVDEIKREWETEQAFIALAKKQRATLSSGGQTTTEKELMDMANHLGDLNGRLSYEEWTTLAIGLWNTAQLEGIAGEVVLQVLETLDGNRQNERYYLGFKLPLNDQNTMATVGTLIALAKEEGFKRSYARLVREEPRNELKIAHTTHKIVKYVDSEAFLELLSDRNRKHLLVSDTNTGKTFASVEASRKYLEQNPNSFVYLALPTTALAEQVASEYQTGEAVRGRINVHKAVKEAIYTGKRFLVGTYDKAPIVHKELNGLEMVVIADEAHKEVSDYRYRYKAIQRLFDIAEHSNVTKFVAMTGTPDEIELNRYDKLTKFELEGNTELADTLQFVTYANGNSYETITAQLINKEVESGNKVLAFINNKTIIKRIAQALNKKGVKTSTVTADNRKSKTYRKLLETQQFDEQTDVILTTVVLADGINIDNPKDVVCMIAPNHYKHAPFYNIDLIRQASHRFRNQYEKILIPLYVKQGLEDERKRENAYNLEQQYGFLVERAEVTKTVIETEFKGKLNLYKSSIAEQLSGLFNPIESEGFNFARAYENKRNKELGLSYDSQLQAELEEIERKLLTIDLRAIRQQASADKEKYYSLHPYAFQRAITDCLSVSDVSSMTAHEYMAKADSDLNSILKEIEKLELKTNEDKRNNLETVLHELIYAKIRNAYFETNRVDESLNEWKLLKERMHPDQYSALTSLVTFLEYQQAIHELKRVRKKAQRYELAQQFEALLTVETFETTKENTVTKLIYTDIKKVLEEQTGMISKTDLDELLEQRAKAFKIRKNLTIAKKQKLFREVFNRFFVLAEQKRTERSRLNRYEPLSLEYIAEQRELPESEILTQYGQYLYRNKGN